MSVSETGNLAVGVLGNYVCSPVCGLLSKSGSILTIFSHPIMYSLGYMGNKHSIRDCLKGPRMKIFSMSEILNEMELVI